MGKRQFELECMISSSVNIVTKGWYICMDSNRGCVSSWKLTQVLGSGYAPPGMVVQISSANKRRSINYDGKIFWRVGLAKTQQDQIVATHPRTN